MSKLSPEEEVAEFYRHTFTKTCSNHTDYMKFAVAYAAHIAAPLKARVAELEYLLGLAEKNYREDQLRKEGLMDALEAAEAQLAQQHKDFVECNDILRKEFEAAEARVKAYEDHPEIADQVKQFADRATGEMKLCDPL